MSTVEKGFIFVLTNSSQPDLVLIGAGKDHPEKALREGLLDDAISGQSPILCYTALVDNLNAATSKVDQTLPSSSFGTGYFKGTTTDAIMAIRNSGAGILYEEASGVDIPPLPADDPATVEQHQVDASQQLVPMESPELGQDQNQYEDDDDLWQQQDIRVNPRPRSWGPVPRGRRQSPVNPYRSNIRDRQARKQDALRKLAAAVDGAEVGGSKPAMIIDDQQPVGLGTGANAFIPNAKAKKRSLDDTRGGLAEAPQHQPPHARTVQQSAARNASQSEPELFSDPEQDDTEPRNSESNRKKKKRTAREPQLSPIGDLPEDLSKNSPKNQSINTQPDDTQDSLNDISMNWLWKRDNDVNTRRENVRGDDGFDEYAIFDKAFDKDSDTAQGTDFDKDSEQFVHLENLTPPATPGLDAQRIESESRLHKAANSPPRQPDTTPASSDTVTRTGAPTPAPAPLASAPDAPPTASSATPVPAGTSMLPDGSKVPLSQRPTPTLEIPLHKGDKPIQPPPPKPPVPVKTVNAPAADDSARAESVPATVPIQKTQSRPEPRQVTVHSPEAPATEAPTPPAPMPRAPMPPPPPIAPAAPAASQVPAKPTVGATPVNEQRGPVPAHEGTVTAQEQQTPPPPTSAQPLSPSGARPPQTSVGRQKNRYNNPRRDGAAVVKIPGGKKEADGNVGAGAANSPVPPPTVPRTRPDNAVQSPDGGKSSAPPASPRAQHDHTAGSGLQPITPPVAATAPPPNIPLPGVPATPPGDSFDAPAPATSVSPASPTPAPKPAPPAPAPPVPAPPTGTSPVAGAATPVNPPAPAATTVAKSARAATAKVDPGEIESWVHSQDKTLGRRISNRRATRWSMLGIPLGALAGAAYLVVNPQIEQMSKISIVVGGIVTGIIVCFLLARLLLTNPKY